MCSRCGATITRSTERFGTDVLFSLCLVTIDVRAIYQFPISLGDEALLGVLCEAFIGLELIGRPAPVAMRLFHQRAKISKLLERTTHFGILTNRRGTLLPTKRTSWGRFGRGLRPRRSCSRCASNKSCTPACLVTCRVFMLAGSPLFLGTMPQQCCCRWCVGFENRTWAKWRGIVCLALTSILHTLVLLPDRSRPHSGLTKI